jgi:acetyl esterase
MLHPQARALIDLLEERGVPAMHTLSPDASRRLYRDRRHLVQPDPPQVAQVQPLQAPGPHGGIALRLYRPLRSSRPASAALPVLIYFHGGGWVIGDLDTHDTLCRELANGAGIAVVAVDYRMGPEHRFPAAVDDCIAATKWVHAQAATLGLDAKRIAVGGDSAGGNLAAVVALAARDTAPEAGPLPIRFQLLIYPATDMRRITRSHEQHAQGYLLTQDTLAYFHDHYIDDAAHDLDWRASPLRHADLPPALVITAGYDPLRDEGLAYSQRLSEAGNRATHICFERQIHGFITMGRVIDEANEAVAICAGAVRRALLE